MAEQKKSKVKELKSFENNYNAQYQTYSFLVTMENGDSGFVDSKKADGADWAVGVEMEYLLEERTKKDGSGKYFKLRKPRKNFSPGGAAPKSLKDYKAEAVLNASKSAIQLITMKDELKVQKHFKSAFKTLIDAQYEELDKLWQQ